MILRIYSCVREIFVVPRNGNVMRPSHDLRSISYAISIYACVVPAINRVGVCFYSRFYGFCYRICLLFQKRDLFQVSSLC